jgi:hypothetical protein
MSDYNELVKFMSGKLPTAIQEIKWQCKNQGKFILVGSIPVELTNIRPTMYDRNHRDSKVWDSEKEVIQDLLDIGKTHFQLSDCSWYDKDQMVKEW